MLINVRKEEIIGWRIEKMGFLIYLLMSSITKFNPSRRKATKNYDLQASSNEREEISKIE